MIHDQSTIQFLQTLNFLLKVRIALQINFKKQIVVDQISSDFTQIVVGCSILFAWTSK